jgi:hypothetical protein
MYSLPAANNFRTKTSSTVDAKFAAVRIAYNEIARKQSLVLREIFLYMYHKVIDNAYDFAHYNEVHVIGCTCSVMVTLYFIISAQRYFTITEEETTKALCLINPINTLLKGVFIFEF